MQYETAGDLSRELSIPKVTGVSFSQIPDQSALFTQYLSDPLSLKEYYPNVTEDPLESVHFLPAAIANYITDRGVLCDALTRINSNLGARDRTLSNIERLRGHDVVAVVTGQQAGLFGGPLYTIYKALSAVKLAEELTATGISAVPVFWMATEDHDFDEVASATVFDVSGELYRAEYRPDGYVPGLPVGRVGIDSSMESVIEELSSALGRSRLSEQIGQCWRSGNTFGRAFGETILALLSDYGLIIFDPLDPALKRLASDIYVRAIENADEIVSAIRDRDEELESHGFHSQVLVNEDYFPLFWQDDNGVRHALKKTADGRFGIKGQRTGLNRDELLNAAASTPERFSPGVMLRPVVQDHILPTVAYFGGGAEISYFAQNSAVYRVLGRPVTPIFHRQSFTLVEPKSKKLMDKVGLEYIDLFKDRDEVILDWGEANIDSETAAVFSSAEESINRDLHRIDERLSRIDTTLLDNLAKRRRKMLYHIAAIRKKTLLALSRQNGDAERRIKYLFNDLMPNGHLQERSINAYNYISRYGPAIIDHIYDAVDLTDKCHRFLEIPNE